MNTLELKQELINQISGIEDIDFLKAIKTILEYKKKDSIINLTFEQERELLLASEDGKKGNIINQSELDKEVKEWLKEK